MDSSSTHLYWKTLNWVYAPLIEKGCVDLLSIREILVVVGYETLCLTLGLACDYSLTFRFAYMLETVVGLLVAYPILIGYGP